MNHLAKMLKNCRRVTIKAGTSILTSKKGDFSAKNLSKLGLELTNFIQKQNKEIVLVSSGAIALGMEVSGIRRRPKEMQRLQACAAIGQGKLMHAYEQFFSKKGLHTAQVLLTRDAVENRERFLRARRTLEELLKMKTLPIVNENDTVSTEEIAFGDNDVLSVHVAHLVQADLLIILSDVDGFYLKDGSRLRCVFSEKEIDQELVKHLKDTKREKTVGGMRAKLEAARAAMRLGIPLLIVNGHTEKILTQVFQGKDVGTIFLPEEKKKNAREKWISLTRKHLGVIFVDDGASRALKADKRSLLASGVLKVGGSFKRGDVVEIASKDGAVFGRGVTRYAERELASIAGKKSSEIPAILGYKYGDEIIHRNDMVIWG